jgi:hypothetical protein
VPPVFCLIDDDRNAFAAARGLDVFYAVTPAAKECDPNCGWQNERIYGTKPEKAGSLIGSVFFFGSPLRAGTLSQLSGSAA